MAKLSTMWKFVWLISLLLIVEMAFSIDSKKKVADLYSYDELYQAYLSAVESQDSVLIVKNVIALSDKERYSGDYDLAFDHIWDALIIAEKNDYDEMLIKINRGLGILYDIYNKDSLALKHLNEALRQSQVLFRDRENKKYHIISNYFSLATFWRDRENYELALQYLDTCEIINNNQRELAYVITDRGYCNLKLGNLYDAETYLFKGKEWLEKIKSPYLVPNLCYIGDLKRESYQFDSALIYYNRSLELMEEAVLHMELKPSLLEKISEIHVMNGDLLKAVNAMKASKESYEHLFSATSKHNQRLFEIRNKYKAELVANQYIITEQDSLIKQKDKDLLGLLVLFGFTFVIGISVYLFFNQRSKIRKLSLIGEMEKDKNKAVLEVKGKELTAYALKMIEMEDAVNVLLEAVKQLDPNKYQTFQRTYSQGSDNSWDEFNRRFTEVNNHFYETLCKKHPELSSTELKHCALIKLNFNGHEMSKILNISQRSVHTSRYRIRKKIGLDSNSSLTSYIGSI